MKKLILKYCLLLLLINSQGFAQTQSSSTQKEEKKDSVNRSWTFTIGGNMINDDTGVNGSNSRYLRNYFSAKSWDFSLVNLGVDYRFNEVLSLNGLFTTNRVDYEIAKNANSGTTKSETIVGLDLNLKLNLIKSLNKNVMPYLIFGLGYTNSRINRGNLNFGFGGYYWIHKNIGLNLQILGKLDVTNYSPGTNYKQNTFGVAYKFPKN